MRMLRSAAVVDQEAYRVGEAARLTGGAEQDLGHRRLQLLRPARPEEEGGDEKDRPVEPALQPGEEREWVGGIAAAEEDERYLAPHDGGLQRRRPRPHPRQPGEEAVEPQEPTAHAEVEVVRRIIAELPEGPEKETVHLFYVEGKLSAREIAEKLGVGKSAVTMRLERFRAKVKKKVLAEVARLRGEES